MGPVLFAVELGDAATVARQAAVASALRRRGVEVLCAVANLRETHDVLVAHDLPFVQAPAHGYIPPTAEPRNYGDYLAYLGHAHAELLGALVDGWSGLLDAARPTAVVASAAPTASIAARLRGLRVVQLSDGFDLPPAASPLPVLRPWIAEAEGAQAAGEARIRETLNGLLSRNRIETVHALHEVYAGETVIASLPELDPFGPRGSARYVGPLQRAAEPKGDPWPSAARRRVVLHLKERTERAATVARAVRSWSPAVIAAIDDRLARRTDCVAATKETLPAFIAHAEVCVFDGDIDIACASVMAGVPLIGVPGTLEGFLVTQRIVAQGLGLGVGLALPEVRGRLREALREITAVRRYREAAQAAAARHGELRRGDGIARVLDVLARAPT